MNTLRIAAVAALLALSACTLPVGQVGIDDGTTRTVTKAADEPSCNGPIHFEGVLFYPQECTKRPPLESL